MKTAMMNLIPNMANELSVERCFISLWENSEDYAAIIGKPYHFTDKPYSLGNSPGILKS